MVFKYVKKKTTSLKPTMYGGLGPLFYGNNIAPLKELPLHADQSIYSDMIGAFSRKMFETDHLEKNYIKQRLYSYIDILKNKGFIFEGEIGSYKDEYNRRNYDLQKHSVGPLKKNLKDFDKTKDVYNFFFIAGCQNHEMLDSRIEKAAILLAGLYNLKKISLDKTYLVLSGWNNAGDQAMKKVNFTNESMIMKNLLILKLKHYLGSVKFGEDTPTLPLNFEEIIINNIITEAKSRNTSENIREFSKVIHRKILKKKDGELLSICKGINVFLVSSTFHLDQLWTDSIVNLVDISKKILHLKKEVLVPIENFYLIGSENESHIFRSTDGHIVKFTVQKSLQSLFTIENTLNK